MRILQANNTQRRNANNFRLTAQGSRGTDRWNRGSVQADMLFPIMLRELLLLSGRGGGL